jgi:3-oxoacyl-[acyl-carrier protein] reductase
VAINYYTSAEGAKATQQNVQSLGRRALVVQADVAKEDQVGAMVEAVESGLGPIDILINNAGWSRMQALEEIDEVAWDAVIAVNLKSVFLVTRAVLPGMRERGWGRIVNVSSGAAQMGGMRGIHYTAAKGGVDALTRAYASRLVSEGITVNAVAPALIETGTKRDNEARRKIVPMGRQGTPEEVADAVVLCAGTGFMTGQSVHMNGGMYYR